MSFILENKKYSRKEFWQLLVNNNQIIPLSKCPKVVQEEYEGCEWGKCFPILSKENGDVYAIDLSN